MWLNVKHQLMINHMKRSSSYTRMMSCTCRNKQKLPLITGDFNAIVTVIRMAVTSYGNVDKVRKSKGVRHWKTCMLNISWSYFVYHVHSAEQFNLYAWTIAANTANYMYCGCRLFWLSVLSAMVPTCEQYQLKIKLCKLCVPSILRTRSRTKLVKNFHIHMQKSHCWRMM
jgi:hypothetical protein